MGITTLDQRTALVLIDLQRGIAGSPESGPVVATAARLAEGFRALGLPVVLVNVSGGAPGRVERPRPGGARPEGWDELLPEIGDGIRITKRTWGAFHGTDLHDRLQAEGVTQVVLGGISTSKGVESTARGAHEHGYNVTVAIDAIRDNDSEAHENSVERIFPVLGETGTSAEILEVLADVVRAAE